MQLQLMPAKTEQGRAEIESRSRKLPGGLRSLLLLVDGRRTVAELQELAKRLNAPEDALQQSGSRPTNRSRPATAEATASASSTR